MALSETKRDERRIEGFRWMLGMCNMMVKDCVGRSGGLAIFWKRGFNVRVLIMSKLYIDVTEVDGFVRQFTGFYGEPSTERKALSWKALRTLNAARSILRYVWEISIRSY